MAWGKFSGVSVICYYLYTGICSVKFDRVFPGFCQLWPLKATSVPVYAASSYIGENPEISVTFGGYLLSLSQIAIKTRFATLSPRYARDDIFYYANLVTNVIDLVALLANKQ